MTPDLLYAAGHRAASRKRRSDSGEVISSGPRGTGPRTDDGRAHKYSERCPLSRHDQGPLRVGPAPSRKSSVTRSDQLVTPSLSIVTYPLSIAALTRGQAQLVPWRAKEQSPRFTSLEASRKTCSRCARERRPG